MSSLNDARMPRLGEKLAEQEAAATVAEEKAVELEAVDSKAKAKKLKVKKEK